MPHKKVPLGQKIAALEGAADIGDYMRGNAATMRASPIEENDARSEWPGFREMAKYQGDPAAMAEFDRFGQGVAWGQALPQMVPHGLGLAAVVGYSGAYELAKNSPRLMDILADALEYPALRVDETTSPPSLGNVLSNAEGFLVGRFKGKEAEPGDERANPATLKSYYR